MFGSSPAVSRPSNRSARAPSARIVRQDLRTPS
jgi:hypothetical protein